MKQTALPPSDADLAAHELTRRIKDARLVAEREQEAEDSVLAAAGEGEAKMALDALSSVFSSRPVEPEELKRQRPKRERISHAKPEPVKPVPETAEATYGLMDATFKKWRNNYLKNPREANRELARDLGGDAALYHRAGIMRINDTLDAINKLGMLKAEKQDDGGEDQEKFDKLVRDMQEELRGWERGK